MTGFVQAGFSQGFGQGVIAFLMGGYVHHLKWLGTITM